MLNIYDHIFMVLKVLEKPRHIWWIEYYQLTNSILHQARLRAEDEIYDKNVASLQKVEEECETESDEEEETEDEVLEDCIDGICVKRMKQLEMMKKVECFL